MVEPLAFVGGGWVPVTSVTPAAKLPAMPTSTNSLGYLYFQYQTLNRALDAAQIERHRALAEEIGRHEIEIRAYFKRGSLAELKLPIGGPTPALTILETADLERILSTPWDDLAFDMMR